MKSSGSHAFLSPLRYPGGKGMLASFMQTVIIENRLADCTYCEPYAGGAGIAWKLLFSEIARRIIISDLNYQIYAFWISLLEHTDELCRMIRDTSVTIEEWHRQKSIYSRPQDSSIVSVGFSTFFLNRANRSGILKGGVIGGLAQSGHWKLDARFNKPDLIKRIERIASYRSRVICMNYDAAEFIVSVLPTLKANTLVYYDPPYFRKGQELYDNFYSREDHDKIRHLISQRQHNWIVSYDDCPEIQDIYSEYRAINYKVSYSANDRYAGAEIMFFSDSLIIPDVGSPTGVNRAR